MCIIGSRLCVSWSTMLEGNGQDCLRYAVNQRLITRSPSALTSNSRSLVVFAIHEFVNYNVFSLMICTFAEISDNFFTCLGMYGASLSRTGRLSAEESSNQHMRHTRGFLSDWRIGIANHNGVSFLGNCQSIASSWHDQTGSDISI